MENENIQGGMELIQGRTLIRSEIYHLSSVWKSPICLAGNRVSKLLLHFLEHRLNLEAVYIGEYALPCLHGQVRAGREGRLYAVILHQDEQQGLVQPLLPQRFRLKSTDLLLGAVTSSLIPESPYEHTGRGLELGS